MSIENMYCENLIHRKDPSSYYCLECSAIEEAKERVIESIKVYSDKWDRTDWSNRWGKEQEEVYEAVQALRKLEEKL